MDYLDSGFNQFLQRSIPTKEPVILGDQFSAINSEVPGLGNGRTSSIDGRLIMDWDGGNLSSSDGSRVRVMIGYIPEEKRYGLKILDSSGNTVFSVAGQVSTSGIADSAVTDAKITSVAAEKIIAGDLIVAVDIGNPATGYVRLDGANNRILVNDGTDNRIVIGDV